MRRWVFILLLFLISGWNWKTHQAIADSFFYSLPESLQNEINRTALEEGSITPDKVFKDFKNHGYPFSKEKADEWLEKAKQHRANAEFNEASYALGIVTHYISDSFAAPHSISGEPYWLHTAYENQGSSVYLLITCLNQTQSLETSVEEGNTWDLWVETRENVIPQRAVQRAMAEVYGTLFLFVNAQCVTQATKIEEREFTITLKGYGSMLFAVMLILMLLKSLLKDLREQPLQPAKKSLKEA